MSYVINCLQLVSIMYHVYVVHNMVIIRLCLSPPLAFLTQKGGEVYGIGGEIYWGVKYIVKGDNCMLMGDLIVIWRMFIMPYFI